MQHHFFLPSRATILFLAIFFCILADLIAGCRTMPRPLLAIIQLRELLDSIVRLYE